MTTAKRYRIGRVDKSPPRVWPKWNDGLDWRPYVDYQAEVGDIVGVWDRDEGGSAYGFNAGEVTRVSSDRSLVLVLFDDGVKKALAVNHLWTTKTLAA